MILLKIGFKRIFLNDKILICKLISIFDMNLIVLLYGNVLNNRLRRKKQIIFV